MESFPSIKTFLLKLHMIFKCFKDLIFSVIPRLDLGIQKKELDFPVKPENDKHWVKS